MYYGPSLLYLWAILPTLYGKKSWHITRALIHKPSIITTGLIGAHGTTLHAMWFIDVCVWSHTPHLLIKVSLSEREK